MGLLQESLAAHLAAGRPLRVLTTVYLGATDRKALDWLVARGARMRVSTDTRRTRLHVKAWLLQPLLGCPARRASVEREAGGIGDAGDAGQVPVHL